MFTKEIIISLENKKQVLGTFTLIHDDEGPFFSLESPVEDENGETLSKNECLDAEELLWLAFEEEQDRQVEF